MRKVVCLIIVLIATMPLLVACEPGTHIIAENRMATEITVLHEAINSKGKVFYSTTWGKVPAGQTAELKLIMLSRDQIGSTVVLKAEDPSGNIVWQRSWPFEEFWKLKDVGWKIVISPETNSQVPST